MNHLDDDAEAFFKSGDEGTYEGGPATLVPLVFHEHEEPSHDWDYHRADEWLERRQRFTRVVATVVGALSAGLLLLSVWLLGVRGHSEEDVSERPRTASLPRVTDPPVRPAALPVAAPPSNPPPPAEVKAVVPVASAAPPPEASRVSELVPAAPAAPQLPEANRVAQTAESPLPIRRVPTAPRQAPLARRLVSQPPPHRAADGASLPRGRADLPSLAGAPTAVHGTPTAVFPN